MSKKWTRSTAGAPGVYYPTKVRRVCDNKTDQTQCRWYFVDFNAELPDSMFEPKSRLEPQP